MSAICLLRPSFASSLPAKELVELSGVKGGLVVHVNSASGAQTADLLINSRYSIQGLIADEGIASVARESDQSHMTNAPMSSMPK